MIPKKRPSVTEIPEIKRKELINSKKLGSEFAENSHLNAIYTSRLLNSFFSKCSTIYSSSKDYTSIELGFDISFSSPSLNLNSKNQSSSTICHPNAIYTSNSNALATVATSLKK
ncbi:hypothetical protein C1645_824981 [Glomus cerebriforme]|uniref:Uncharacterized protein n=1 Tax=Glomus cerebriforme TaxID=658196 RepID=A0A397SUF2_9GLOM|nr:hypothetical protein C1645_824981 [Glomus cerebriforme]